MYPRLLPPPRLTSMSSRPRSFPASGADADDIADSFGQLSVSGGSGLYTQGLSLMPRPQLGGASGYPNGQSSGAVDSKPLPPLPDLNLYPFRVHAPTTRPSHIADRPNPYAVPPLPKPPLMQMPSPVHYGERPDLSIYHSHSAPPNPADQFPTRPRPPASVRPASRPTTNNLALPSGKTRASSVPPPSPTRFSSSDGEGQQCSGVTKAGKRCTRTVKTSHPVKDVERYCFQHMKDILSPTGFYWRNDDKEWVTFDGSLFHFYPFYVPI